MVLIDNIKKLVRRRPHSAGLLFVMLTFAVSGLIALATSRAATPLPLGAAGNWNLMWSDEFDGTTLDMTKWNVMESWHSPPGAKFSDADTWCPLPMPAHFNAVSNGTLKMNMYNQPAGGQPTQACELNTRNHFENFTEGYIEARIKNPSAAEAWTGYWLMGNGTGSNGWPRTGEVDIFEFVNNGSGHGTPFFSVHYAGPCDAWNHCAHTQSSPWPTPIADYASQFHTYGLKRTKSGLEIYIDGVFKYKFTPDMKNANGQQLASYLFDGPMHAILTIKSGGNWGSDPNKSPESGTMEVDYVRAWSIGTTSGGDSTAPAVTITAPTAGTTLSGTAKVTASATDAVAVSRTELHVDGILKSTDTTAPYELTLDTTTLTNGTHVLQVKAADAAGNIGSSATVSVTVSNTTTSLPDVIVTDVSIVPATPQPGDMVVLSATIKNQGAGPTPAGVPVGVRYDIDGVQTHWAATSALAAGESRTITSTNSMTLPDVAYWTAVQGTHTLKAYVDDVNRFAESSETNNTMSRTITIGATAGRISQTGNLATGRTFTSNVGTINGTTHAMINNQNESDRWISAVQDTVTIGTDLGSDHVLNKVSILWAGDTTRNYDLQVSPDNVNWKTVASGVTNNTTPQLIDTTTFSSTASGRYFRVLAKDRWNAAYGHSIWEIGLYGSPMVSIRLPGDVNGDQRINAVDLSFVLSKDGQNYTAADFNKDGVVGAADMAILLGKWTW